MKKLSDRVSSTVSIPLEISASEINLLCRRISSSIDGYSVSSIYSIQGGILLRLRHETKEERLIAISSFAPWITTKNLSLEHAEPFVVRIREIVERSRLISVRQEGTERICTFSFTSRSGEKHNLHAEFFGGGNIILTNAEEKIIDVENAQRFRHRSLVPGEKYALPPSRGKSLDDIDADFLYSELAKAKSNSTLEKMDAIRWFGRIAGTSRKFVEEVFFISEISPDLPINQLGENEIYKLARSSSKLANEIEGSAKGYLLVPKENVEDLEVDVCPLVPHTWRVSAEKGLATIREFESFNQALDEAQIQAVVFERKQKASKEIRFKAAELESAIRKQDVLLQGNSQNSIQLRNLGNELMSAQLQDITSELTSKLELMNILERDEIHNDQLRFKSEPTSFLSSFATPKALASRLFSEAKRLEQSNEEITRIREGLIKRREGLLEQSRTFEDRASKRISIERRPRQWFERYRWFLTSDLRLAVGGRDTTSNSIIINKYMDQNCLVFHADLHGSPFFILKNARDSENPPLSFEVEQEVAQATAAFSRAWKDELGSADAYWVEPQQIKKSAPSGEYLPRGSFFIEGKKNFVKHLKIELCIGLIPSEILPRTRIEDTYEEEQHSAVVICGPEKALAKYCVSQVKIAPGRERGSSIAKRVKQLLVTKIKEDQTGFKELAKRIPVDEIIRALPSGSYKLVSEKQNG